MNQTLFIMLKANQIMWQNWVKNFSFFYSSSVQTILFVSAFMNGISVIMIVSKGNIWSSSNTISGANLSRRKVFFLSSCLLRVEGGFDGWGEFLVRRLLINCLFCLYSPISSILKIRITSPHSIAISQNARLEGFRKAKSALFATAAFEVRAFFIHILK